MTGGISHTEAMGLYDPYLDARLALAERLRFESHLDGCEPCRTGYQKYERAVMMVRKLKRRKAPLGFSSAVMQRVRRDRRVLHSNRAGIVLFYKLQIPHAALTLLLLVGCAAEVVALLLTQ